MEEDRALIEAERNVECIRCTQSERVSVSEAGRHLKVRPGQR